MFDFFRKSKVACLDLAEMLAPRFISSTIKMFEAEINERGDQSWTRKAEQTHLPTSLQEWLLFCLAAYIQGCRISMNQDQIHFAFVKYFLELVAHNVTNEGIFPTADEFMSRSHERLSEYLAAFSNTRPEDSMKAVARAFLGNVGCPPDDIVLIVGASGSFMSEAITSKELFDKIQKSYRLVL